MRPTEVRGDTPLRVLMTADAVGGVWQYALDLSSSFRQRGLHVTIAAMGPEPGPEQVAMAKSRGIDVISSSYALEWMDDPWRDVDAAGSWLLELERRLQPDVVHLNGYCHAHLPWQAPAIVVAHSCVCSWWRSVHATAAPSRYAEYRARVTRGLTSARIVVAPSGAMLAAVVDEYGPVFADGRVIPNGRIFMRADEDDAIRSKARFVFAAGRLWDEAKNMAGLCEAAASVGWPVYVAGDARPPNRGAGVPARSLPHLICLGRLPSTELHAWYEDAAIYAMPARYEPFGLSVLDAAAAGCALVLGDIGSLREHWTGAAVFVPPGDSAALAAAIRRLIVDDTERENLGRRARVRARSFDIERTADQYLRAYADVRRGAQVAAATEAAH